MVTLKSYLYQPSSEWKLNYHRRAAKDNMDNKLGSKRGSDMIHNCLTCARWPVCKDVNKSVVYRCSRFKENVIEPTSLDELFKPENLIQEDEIEYTNQDDSEESILEMIAKVIDSNIPVPPDLRINDREIPEAENFYQWTMDSRFAKSGKPPFPRQVEIGLKIFADWCPRCSDEDWFDDVAVDSPLAEFEDRLVFLKNGVCPKCKVGRSELILSGEISNVYGVVGLAGQRCVVGNTLIPTTHGMRYIRDIVHPSYKKGFNKFKTPNRQGYYTGLKVTLENGQTRTPSDFYISEKEYTYKVSTALGLFVEGTPDHPVMTERGFVKLKDITKDDFILVHGGQNVWSDVDHIDYSTAKLIGYVISEGHKVSGKQGNPQSFKITNADENVLSFCMNQLRLLGFEPRLQVSENRTPDIVVNRIGSRKDIEFLFGKFGVRSKTISTPESVLQSGKAIVAGYLRGLFEGDGYVSSRHNNIHYTSLSRKLINEVQVLLLNMGIFSYVRTHEAHATNGTIGNLSTAYTLTISGHESLALFAREIGFDSERKTKGLVRLISKKMPFTTDKLTPTQVDNVLQVFNAVQEDLQQYQSTKSNNHTLRELGIRLDRLNKREFLPSRLMILKAVDDIINWEFCTLIEPKNIGNLYALKAEFSKTRFYSPVVDVKKSKKKKTTYDFTVPDSHRFMANGLLNHNSSKTLSVILWDSYNLHRTLKLPSPQNVFGILDNTPITSTYAATTFAQAVENVWNPYKSTLTDTPWFKNYHKFLERRGNELGEELFNLGEHMVRYRHRNLVLSPSGPNKRTMRGRSRITGLVDEIGWFKTNKKSKPGEELELMDAKGVFDALDNSLETLKNSHKSRIEEGYNNLPRPMMYIVSSPSHYNDFIMSSYRLFQNSPERYCFRYATWDYNPLYKKKNFAERFRTKPVETARDFECNPPIGESLFINDHAPLIKAFKYGPNKIRIDTKKEMSKGKNWMTTASVQLTANALPTFGTILCVDVGLTNNSFSFSIIGPPDDYDGELLPEDRGTMQTPVRVYAVGEIIPRENTKISITSVYTECFIPLVEPFNIKYMVSDRWQNVKIAQDLEDGYEVVPLEHKCKWSDFEATRELLYSGNLQLPRLTESFEDIMKTTLDNYPECFRNRPIDHLAWQFATVRESTGVTVQKGEGGTDDTFRTIVLGIAQMQEEDILEDLLNVNVKEAKKEHALALVVKMSNGGGGRMNSGGGNESVAFVKKFGR